MSPMLSSSARARTICATVVGRRAVVSAGDVIGCPSARVESAFLESAARLNTRMDVGLGLETVVG